jgi:cell division protein FtsQ
VKKRSPLIRKKNVKKEAKRRRFRFFGRAFLALALAGALIWGGRYALMRFDFFALRKIEILGAPQSLSQAEILKRVQVPIGTNLFKIPVAEVQGRLMLHPYFKAVSVQRRMPHTLAIDIRERLPAFVLNASERLFYVDADGEIFKDISDSDDSRDMVILSGFDEDQILIEAQSTRKRIADAALLQKLFRETGFGASMGLSEIQYEKNIGFTLYPEKKKYSIKMGLKDFPEKLKKFQEIWDKIEKSKSRISSIDLNYPGKVLMTL